MLNLGKFFRNSSLTCRCSFTNFLCKLHKAVSCNSVKDEKKISTTKSHKSTQWISALHWPSRKILGQSLVEYILILIGISVAAIFVFRMLGSSVNSVGANSALELAGETGDVKPMGWRDQNNGMGGNYTGGNREGAGGDGSGSDSASGESNDGGSSSGNPPSNSNPSPGDDSDDGGDNEQPPGSGVGDSGGGGSDICSTEGGVNNKSADSSSRKAAAINNNYGKTELKRYEGGMEKNFGLSNVVPPLVPPENCSVNPGGNLPSLPLNPSEPIEEDEDNGDYDYGGVIVYDEDGVPIFDESHEDFHHYYGSNSCSKSTKGCTFANGVAGLLRYPAPGASGEPVVDEQESFAMPVGRVRHEVYNDGAEIINVTLEGEHMLNPGIVRRWVTEDALSVTIHTYGEGTGLFSTANEFFSDSLWEGVDNNIFDYMRRH